MRYLMFAVAVILLILGGIYIILFTGPGNRLIQPIAEKRLAKLIDGQIKLNQFTLRTNRFILELNLDQNSTILLKGKLNLFKQDIDANFNISIKELSKLEQLIGLPLRGHLDTRGTIKGNLSRLAIKGNTDLGDSKTEYEVLLLDFNPNGLVLVVNDAQIDKLFYMANQPSIAKGLLDINLKLDISDLSSLKGNGKLKVRHGIVNYSQVNQAFNLKLTKPVAFTLESKALFKNSMATANLKLDSDIINFTSKKSIYNTSSSDIIADYQIIIPDLEDLYFVTNCHLNGSLNLYGNAKFNKTLLLNGKAKIMGGDLDIKIDDNLLKADLKGIETISISELFIYPRVFSSRGNVKIKYDLNTKQGTLNANLINGRFLPNQLTILMDQLLKWDVHKDIYKDIVIQSKINGSIIISDLEMSSRRSRIKANKAKIDLDQEQVDSVLKISVKGIDIIAKIRGDLKKPGIKLDTSALMKEKLRQKLDKTLEKNIPQKYQAPIQDILDLFIKR